MKKIILLLILITICIFSTNISLDSSDVLKLGIFPRKPVRVIYREFTPFANFLSKKLNIPVRLVLSKSYSTFENKLFNNKIDIAHMNQYQVYLLRNKPQFSVFAMNKEFGTTYLKGAIYVRKNSNISSIEDLKGKTLVFGGGKTAYMYYSTKKILKSHGLNRGDYTEKYAPTVVSAITALARGIFDAACTGNVVHKLPIVKKNGDHLKVKILTESEPFPHLPWVINNTLPVSLQRKIMNIFYSMHTTQEGRNLLKNIKIQQFIPANNYTYRFVADTIKYVEEE